MPLGAREPEELELLARQKKELSEVDSPLWISVASWLRKHGKNVKPKLGADQMNQLCECFRLMDQDGSGAIDVDELGAALKLLGIRMKPSEVQQLVDEVDFDGTGELELDEFLNIMTTTMQRVAEEGQSKNGSGNQVPFGLVATAYRRKRLMEGIMSSDRSIHRTIQQMGEQHVHDAMAAQLKEAEAEHAAKPSSSSNKLKASVFGKERIRHVQDLKFDESLIASFPPSEQQVIMRVLNTKGATFQRSASAVIQTGSQPLASPSDPPSSPVASRRFSHGLEGGMHGLRSPAASIRTGANDSFRLQSSDGHDRHVHVSPSPQACSPAQTPLKLPAGVARSASVDRAVRNSHYANNVTHQVLMRDSAQTFGLKFSKPLIKLPQHMTSSRCSSPACGSPTVTSPRSQQCSSPQRSQPCPGSPAPKDLSRAARANLEDALQIQGHTGTPQSPRGLRPTQSRIHTPSNAGDFSSCLVTMGVPQSLMATPVASMDGRHALQVSASLHGLSSTPSGLSLPPVMVNRLAVRCSTPVDS